jgi:hypothetical protein
MAEHERMDEQNTGEVSLVRRWSEYLVAILAGNIVYLFAEPQLPTALQHRVSRIDLGLGIDFLICVAAYGAVRLARAWSNTRA